MRGSPPGGLPNGSAAGGDLSCRLSWSRACCSAPAWRAPGTCSPGSPDEPAPSPRSRPRCPVQPDRAGTGTPAERCRLARAYGFGPVGWFGPPARVLGVVPVTPVEYGELLWAYLFGGLGAGLLAFFVT